MNEGMAFEARIARRQRNLLWRAWITFRRWPVIPMAILSLMIIFAIFAPLLSPNDPLKQSLRLRYVPPIWAGEERAEKRVESPTEYILGTDNLGRDILKQNHLRRPHLPHGSPPSPSQAAYSSAPRSDS